MKITERLIRGKLDNARCEDGIAATDSFMAVADGSTSKTELRIRRGMTNGQLCMKLVCRYIESMPEGISMEDFCDGVTAAVAGEYRRAGVDMRRLENMPADRMTASVAVYSDRRREIWMVGDCQAMIDGCLYVNPKPYEREIAEERAAILKKALAEGATIDELRAHDVGREHILPRLKAATKGQNIMYPVVDGFDIPAQLVNVISVGEGRHDIVLASDGYPLLKPSLEESEEALERLLAEDPLCISQNVATKGLAAGQQSFDDRTYLRFTV